MRSIRIFKLPIFLILIVLIIFFIDENTAIFIDSNINEKTYRIFSHITSVGDFLSIFILNLTTLTYLFTKYKTNKTTETKNKYKQKTKLLIYGIFGQFLLMLATQSLKYIFGRSRPYNYLENLSTINEMFTFLNFNEHYVSFPSGHTSGIWGISICMLITFKDNKYSKIWLALATTISISRIILNKHYISDVLFSVFLSVYIVKYTIEYLNKKDPFKFVNRISL